jgi:hypothetical protein
MPYILKKDSDGYRVYSIHTSKDGKFWYNAHSNKPMTLKNAKIQLRIVNEYEKGKKGEGLTSLILGRNPTWETIKLGSELLRSSKPTREFKNFLNSEDGNTEIDNIKIGRTPVNSNIQKLLNLISFGGLNRVKKRLKYDFLWHQYIIVTLKNGRKYKLERNQTVQTSTPKDEDFKNLLIDIPVSKSLTPSQLIDKADNKDPNFYVYNPSSSNCQQFVKQIIDKNQLLPEVDTSQVLKTQDSKQIIDSIPNPLRDIPLVITNLGNIADNLGMLPKIGSGLYYDSNDLVKSRLIIDGLI